MYGILVAPNTIVAVRDRCVGGGDNAELGTRRVSMGLTRRRSVFCWSEEESEWEVSKTERGNTPEPIMATTCSICHTGHRTSSTGVTETAPLITAHRPPRLLTTTTPIHPGLVRRKNKEEDRDNDDDEAAV